MPPLRSIAVAAELAAPVAEEIISAARSAVSDLTRSPLTAQGASTLARSALSREALSEPLLSARRFLRHDPDSAYLDSVPINTDWSNRKEELSQVIAKRVNDTRLSAEEFWRPLQAFDRADQPIVRSILNRSAGSATELGLMNSLDSLAGKVEARFPNAFPAAQFFAAGPSSPGNMLAYLMRKSQTTEQTTRYFDSVKQTYRDLGRPIFIFDDLSALQPAGREALLEFQITHPIAAIDVNGFERTVNFIDYAHGQPAVVAKLQGLLEETKAAMRSDAHLDADGAVERVLNQGFDQSVAEHNRLAEAKGGLPPIIAFRSAPVSPHTALQTVVTPQQVTSFLEQHFDGHPEARVMAAELLAQDVEFHSLSGFIPKLQDLKEALSLSAKNRGLDPKNDLFVVGADGNVGSSDAFITYLYKHANALEPERIVTLMQLVDMRATGELTGRRIIANDDAIYNGYHSENLLDKPLAPFRHVVLATLSSFNNFAKRMHHGEAFDRGIRELVNLQTDLPIGSVGGLPRGNPLFSHRTLTEQAILNHTIAPALDIRSLASLKVFPHMTSDTSPYWLEKFATRFPLTFEHFSAVKEKAAR